MNDPRATVKMCNPHKAILALLVPRWFQSIFRPIKAGITS